MVRGSPCARLPPYRLLGAGGDTISRGQADGVEGAEGPRAALSSIEVATAIEVIAPVMAMSMVMSFAIEMTDKYVSGAFCRGVLIPRAAGNAPSSICQCLEAGGPR